MVDKGDKSGNSFKIYRVGSEGIQGLLKVLCAQKSRCLFVTKEMSRTKPPDTGYMSNRFIIYAV